MKWLTIKLSIILSLLFGNSAFAQEVDIFEKDSISTKYQKNIAKYKKSWNRLIPTYGKTQYAGSMGFLSMGVGWDSGKNRQWETDIFIGFVPKYSSRKNKLTFTIRQNFIPWNMKLKNENFSIDPLACGIYVTTLFGNDYWTSDPDRYPRGYYTISTRFRINAYLGQRFTFHIPGPKRKKFKSLTFYYEISSNDVYIMSAASNSYLKPKDYLHLSFGLKALYF